MDELPYYDNSLKYIQLCEFQTQIWKWSPMFGGWWCSKDCLKIGCPEKVISSLSPSNSYILRICPILRPKYYTVAVTCVFSIRKKMISHEISHYTQSKSCCMSYVPYDIPLSISYCASHKYTYIHIIKCILGYSMEDMSSDIHIYIYIANIIEYAISYSINTPLIQ